MIRLSIKEKIAFGIVFNEKRVYQHWYTRFLMCGVDLERIRRVVARIKNWYGWCSEWSKEGQFLENMAKDAEAHAEEDKKKREVVDLKNQADQLIYSTEKTLKEHGDKVSADVRSNIENAVNNLKEAVKGEDADAIKKTIENLGTASQELGKVLYEEAAKKQAASGPQPQPGPTGQAPPPSDEDEPKRKQAEDVIDAEFEAKDK